MGSEKLKIDIPYSPAELRKLSIDELPSVCEALRGQIVDTLSVQPGHFASSMGAVEITVALHYVFNTPDDHIVWDVGHQAYSHKLLTERKDRFNSLRTEGGLSGFPNPAESKYDTFTAGHASNSISAALGMDVADRLNNRDNHTVALVGDASISGGLAFEGLNNVSNQPNNLLIVLNDNDMSIDDNVGALHRYLSELTTSSRYNKFRFSIYKFLKKIRVIDDRRKGLLLRLNNSLKAFIAGNQNIFEGLNIRYFGPFDGHDVKKLVRVLNDIKDMQGPRLLHIRTVKGKGFKAAEQAPAVWHAPGKFDPVTGEREKSAKTAKKWQEVFGEHLVELAKKDSRVVGITAAMPSGTSVSKLIEEMPERSFDVGISEGHAVTFAGGLASTGMRPFVAIYSSFLQRAYDNVIHDVAIAGLPVTFCIDRAGIVGEDGVTHHGMFDICALRVIPGMHIASPSDAVSLRVLMEKSLEASNPMAIRYPRGNAVAQIESDQQVDGIPGHGRVLLKQEGSQVSIITLGPVAGEALEAAKILQKQGIAVSVYDAVWVKPLDENLLKDAVQNSAMLITVEDGACSGGFGSTVQEWVADNSLNNKVIRLGVPDEWVHHGKPESLRSKCGFDAQGIVNTVKTSLTNKCE